MVDHEDQPGSFLADEKMTENGRSAERGCLRRTVWLLWQRSFYCAIAGLALLGLAFASYLTYLDYSRAEAAFCEVGSGCDTVRSSEYANLLGVPVAIFGVMGYIAIIGVALAPLREPIKRLLLFVMGTIGLAFSLYFTYIEVFVIRAICPYCVMSAGTMTAIFVLLVLQRPIVPRVAAHRLAFLGGIVAICVVAGAAFLPKEITVSLSREFSQIVLPGQVPEEEFRVSLARHLRTIGVVLYGAFWCPHCADQKKMFGDAAHLLNYVECDASGEGGNPQLCRAKGIEFLPTWEIDGHLYVGVKTLEELARLSRYEVGSPSPPAPSSGDG